MADEHEGLGDPARSAVDDYPYDPGLDSESLLDLEKLRAMADRRMALLLYDLFVSRERYQWEVPPTRTLAPARSAVAGTAQRGRSNEDRVVALAERALRGGFGVECQRFAVQTLFDPITSDRHRLGQFLFEQFERSLQSIRQRRALNSASAEQERYP